MKEKLLGEMLEDKIMIYILIDSVRVCIYDIKSCTNLIGTKCLRDCVDG